MGLSCFSMGAPVFLRKPSIQLKSGPSSAASEMSFKWRWPIMAQTVTGGFMYFQGGPDLYS